MLSGCIHCTFYCGCIQIRRGIVFPLFQIKKQGLENVPKLGQDWTPIKWQSQKETKASQWFLTPSHPPALRLLLLRCTWFLPLRNLWIQGENRTMNGGNYLGWASTCMHILFLYICVCMYFLSELLIIITAYLVVGTIVSISHINSFNPHNILLLTTTWQVRKQV